MDIVQRGQCQFVDKAQRLGANAVVVGGDNPETSGNPDTLVNMYSPGEQVINFYTTENLHRRPARYIDRCDVHQIL